MDANTQTQPLQLGGTVKAVFRSTLPNMRYALKNGKECYFLNGEYHTNSEAEVKEFMAEIEAGHDFIYFDPERALVDTKFVDPLEAIKARIIADLKAQGRLIDSGESDFGESDTTLKLKVGNTRDVAEAMSGSTSGAGAGTFVAAGLAAARTITPGPKA